MVTEVIAMSKTVGYARVSTNEQNLDRQLQALGQYVEPDMIVTDKASGRNLDRAGYQSLKVGIGKLVSGDTLYITSLDRLSRNKEDLKKELQYFKEKGVKVKILDMPTTMTDFPTEQAWIGDMITNIMIEVLSSIAQNERETTRKRQLEGLSAMPTDSCRRTVQPARKSAAAPESLSADRPLPTRKSGTAYTRTGRTRKLPPVRLCVC